MDITEDGPHFPPVAYGVIVETALKEATSAPGAQRVGNPTLEAAKHTV